MVKSIINPLLIVLALASPALANFTQADSAKAKAYCQGESFMSTTVLGIDPDNARAKAKAEIARNIISQVKSKIETVNRSDEKEGVFKESSKFLEKNKIESDLTILGSKEIEFPKRQESGEYELRAYVCVKDVAKPYIERQRILAESMEIAKDWNKIQNSWNEFMNIQILLEVLRVESKYFASAKKIYEKARDDYKANCNIKLHWKPERKSAYSDIAYQKLYNSLGMESLPCRGKSIMIVYSGTEPECTSRGGPWGCTYQPSLRITSCNGEQSDNLPNPAAIKSFGDKKEIAEERLQNKLRTADFWNEWEQKIEQRRPQCEQ